MPRVSLFECALPLHVPFVTALRRVDTARDVLFLLEDGAGQLGLGSAPPTLPLTGETTATLLAFFEHVVVPFLKKQPLPSAVEEVRELRRSFDGLAAFNTGAKGALEMALLDLIARKQALPLCDLFSASCPTSSTLARWSQAGTPECRSFATDLTLSIDTPEAMALRLQASAKQDFQSFKVKLSGEPSVDAARVGALVEACKLFASRPRLRLDANEAFGTADAVRFFRSMEDAHGEWLDCVEQPVARNDWQGLKAVSRALHLPVFADEAASSLAQCRFLIEQEACDGVVVKLAKSGGPLGALEWCELCAEARLGVLFSCMLECQASLTAAFHVLLAFVRAHPEYASPISAKNPVAPVRLLVDLDGTLLLAGSPFLVGEGLIFEHGWLRLSEATASSSGLGLHIDSHALESRQGESARLRAAGAFVWNA